MNILYFQEQASHIQSPGLFNLDDMQSSDDQLEEKQNETVSAAALDTAGNGNTAADSSYSTPVKNQQQVIATTNNNVEATTSTPKVTKLETSSEDADDFNFDSWGEDEINVTEDNVDNSDETAERMRQESQKLAQKIMEEEQRKQMEEERLRAEEEERKKRQQLLEEEERIKREKMLQEEEEMIERERMRKLEEEKQQEERRRLEVQQRLEQEEREMQAAKEAQAAEEERLKMIRGEEAERAELERQAQEDARAAEEQRLQQLREEEEQERLRLVAEEEEEAKRLEEVRAEKERLQKEREQERLRFEEEQRQLEEQQRLESEREAQKEAAAEKERQEEEKRNRLRIEEEAEEAKRLEEKRLEDERQAEEDIRIAEELRLRMKQEEEEEREHERLRLEEDVHQSLEQEAAEHVKSKDSVLDDEITNEVGDDGWSDHSEQIDGDDEIFSSESAAEGQAQSHPEVEEIPDNMSVTKSSHELDVSPDTLNYDDLSAHEEAPPDSEPLDLQDSISPVDAQGSSRDDNSDTNVVQQNNTGSSDQNNAASSVEKVSDNTFFGAAAADLASSMFENQATNLFTEASKTASMFSWGKSSAQDYVAAPPTSETTNVEAETKDKPIAENDLFDDDDLDAMYDDDDESDDSEAHDETENQEVDTAQNDDNGENLDTKVKEESSTPLNSSQHTVENFVKQLERMSESHQLEMNEMQRTHQLEIDALRQELSLERDKKEKDKARKEVASQDKFLSQMRELEKKFNNDLKEKDDELQTVMERNEGMRLKMDSMKHEVDGLIKLVDERDDEIAKLKQGHGKSMVQVEGKVKYSEEELARKDAKISELNASVSSLQADLDSTTEAYHTLKERAKSVATELKDRRVEVRSLTSQNQELSSSKTLHETQLANLRAVINQHELTIGYKDKDMEVLDAKVKELQKQIEGKEKSIQDNSAVGEKAIASYKRKAQEALAAANSRLALSNQAREEAESEAKAAKSTSDDAVKRARDAESKMSEAEQRANAATSLLDELKLSSNDEINKLKDTVDDLRSTIDAMQVEAEEDSTEREKLNVEIGQLRTNLVEVKKKESELRQKLIEQQALCTSLQKEVNDLNDEVQRNSAAAFKRANDEKSLSDNGTERNFNALSFDVNGHSKDRVREEADGTIIMLQQELHGANEAIADLKLALRTALLEKTAADPRDEIPDGNNEAFDSDSPHGNDSTPLFYAIEKQNELNTARDEINRLANMLGDAEAEKQEAYDIMEDMRHKMEDANARLLRYEKLGMKGARPHQNVSQSSYGPFRSTQSSSITSNNNLLSSGNDSVVNLEYLKNVMLSYLKAKTLADRRKLVPVIATVLCLTPEEQAQAVNSVEDSAGLSGVAVSFWENLGESTSITGFIILRAMSAC